MASWNEIHVGDQQEACPVCRCLVSKKRLTRHVTECSEKYEDYMEEVGLMKCPLMNLHIIPRAYLNHHLDGNCEAAQNMLRKYFQIYSVQNKAKRAPDHFLADVPDNILNRQNKQLLFYVKRNLKGEDISSNENLYPEE